MAGGILPTRPFSFNLKCVVFTAIIAGGYWNLPPKNIYALIFLMWSPYLAMSYYDYMYNCEDKLKPTSLPLGRLIYLPLKPEGYKKEYEKMSPEQKGIMDKVDHITLWTLLIIFISIVIIYNKK
jgi:hypothetical protein